MNIPRGGWKRKPYWYISYMLQFNKFIQQHVKAIIIYPPLNFIAYIGFIFLFLKYYLPTTKWPKVTHVPLPLLRLISLVYFFPGHFIYSYKNSWVWVVLLFWCIWPFIHYILFAMWSKSLNILSSNLIDHFQGFVQSKTTMGLYGRPLWNNRWQSLFHTWMVSFCKR